MSFILVQGLSSVFANVGVHHRFILMEGVLAARVIQLCVYHRALEHSESGQSESKVQAAMLSSSGVPAAPLKLRK